MLFLKKLKKYFNLIFTKKKFRQFIALSKMFFFEQNTKYPKEVIKFEKNFAKYIGAKYASSFCNGTSAFEAALFALGLEDDDEVIICGMSFHSVIMNTLFKRLKVIYVDMDENLNMKIDERIISNKTKLIIICHWFGYSQNMKQIINLVKKYRIYLIEDCSHAHGADYNGKKLGNFGDISFFSLQGDKAISGGEGGIAVTNNDEYFKKMTLYGHLGREMQNIESHDIFKNRGYGKKYRMHPFAAVLANEDLKDIDKRNLHLRKSIKTLEKIIGRYDFMKIIHQNDNSTIGGFHIGIPIWASNEKIAHELIYHESKFFKKYPYKHYFKHDIFKSGKYYVDLINKDIPTKLKKNEDSLIQVEKAEKYLIFFDLKKINKIKKYSSDLIKLLDKYR